MRIGLDAVYVRADTRTADLEWDPEKVRFVTLGLDAMARVLVVVYVLRAGDSVRLISAREATRTECRQYEEKR